MAFDSPEQPRIRPTLWLSLAACLAFPPIWNALLPSSRGDPIVIALGPPRPDDALTLPTDRIDARPWATPAGELPPSVSFAFELAHAGHYSVYGISSHVASAPLDLWIDDAHISTRAFYAATGSLRRNFERRRIATGLTLEPGLHTVKLQGPHLSIRTFALELQREAPLGPLRYATLAAVAGFALGLRRLCLRVTLSPRRRLLATSAFAIAPATLALLAVAQTAGSALISTNRAEVSKIGSLRSFESYLDSQQHQARGSRFSVAVLGDSTHFFALDASESMLPSIERTIEVDQREQIQIYGVAARAFSAFDYYLLLNRLVVEAPDLVVIPVNARSFGDEWIDSAGHDFSTILRYLRTDELWVAPDVVLARRRLAWAHVLIRRIDEAIAGSRVALLLRGLRRQVQADLGRVTKDAAPDWLSHPSPLAPEPVPASAASAWPRAIASDHPMLAFFDAINRLAARHDVEILYYTVQSNVQALAKLGASIDLPALYAEIEREISGGPGIHYLDLSRSNPPWMFLDASDHLSERGMRAVAGRLARRIGEIYANDPSRSNLNELGTQ